MMRPELFAILSLTAAIGCASKFDLGENKASALGDEDAAAPAPAASSPAAATADSGSGSTCGGQTCRAHQTCVAGGCATPCVGKNVPGDYANVQDAVTALKDIGGTICVGAATLSENVYVQATQPLVISGTSSLSTLRGQIVLAAGPKLTVRDLSIVEYSPYHRGSIVVGGARAVLISAVRFLPTTHPGLFVDESDPQLDLLVDGCEFAGATGVPEVEEGCYQAGVCVRSHAPEIKVAVQNSWFHGAANGLRALKWGPSGTLSFINNTLVDNGTAIHVVSDEAGSTFRYANNVIAKNQIGVTVEGTSGTVTSAANLWFGNATKLQGAASAGTGDIDSDPNLDGSTPPRPKAGSPARAAANASFSPASDYFGIARPSTPAIGAVEP